MWVRHVSVVIVPPEGDWEFRWDSEMCWCFIHVTIKLVSGTTRTSVIESCITQVSSSPRETVLREICFLVDLDRRKKIRRVCVLDTRCVFLSFSSLPKCCPKGTNIFFRFLERNRLCIFPSPIEIPQSPFAWKCYQANPYSC